MFYRYSQKIRPPAVLSLLALILVFSGCSGSSDNGSVLLEGASVEIVRTYTADTPAAGYRERAMMTQASGEYVGVDDWADSDAIPAGARLVNGGTSGSYSSDFSDRSTVAYSNYFTTEKTRDDATSGGLLDASMFNGLVEVGPWRANGATGNFTYRRYGMTYDVVRPMPVVSSICRNNPQMDTAGAGGAAQYFAPFIRQDLIRLGYVRISGAVDSSEASRVSTLPRYVDLYSRTTTSDELAALALADYATLMTSRTPPEQARAAALRAEAIALRTDQKRSDCTFTARATAGDLSLAAGRRVDGYARVGFDAFRNITLGGVIRGSDRISSSAYGRCLVDSGALVEAWTDRISAGNGAISFACDTIAVDGRVQTQAAPWTSWSQGVPGKITLAAASADNAVTGISLGVTGQVLALLQTSQTDASLNAVRMTSPGSGIDIDGPGYGFNVVADKGTIFIENTGAQGTVNILDGAALSADVVRACARGDYGTLVIHAGANLDANTLIKLIGGISAGGKVVFRGTGDVVVTSGTGTGPIVVSADTVEVETGVRLVTRSWVQTGSAWNRADATADVYCNACIWSAAWGGDPAAGYEGTWSVMPNRAGSPAANQCF